MKIGGFLLPFDLRAGYIKKKLCYDVTRKF